MNLPADLDPVDFDERFRLDTAAWIPAIQEICSAHGIAATPLETFADGSNLIARAGDRFVVKIFPPFHKHQWLSEHLTTSHLSGRTLIPIPDLLAAAERPDGWPYTISTFLPGDTLEAHWATLAHSDKESLIERIGQVMAQVHSVPVGELHSLPPTWETFLCDQVARCRSHHERLGMPVWFTDQLDQWIQLRAPHLLTSRPVILTGEYTPFNLLIVPNAHQKALSGMIDFGDAMVGHPDYDLLGPSAFLACGDRHLVRALFRGYGYENPDNSLRQRLMALLALHRYSNLSRQLRIPDWTTRAHSIDSLMNLIWPE